jgi:hypothetical protein
MISKSVISNIYNGTCAVGINPNATTDLRKTAPNEFEIHGTGFQVHNNILVTNRHVVDAINARLKQLNLPNNAVAQFTFPEPNGEMIQCFLPLRKAHRITDELLDIAVLVCDPPMGNVADSLTRLPLIDDVVNLEIGEPIGVMGFPYGSQLHLEQPQNPADPPNLVRIGPLLQQGHLSGFRPWQNVRGLQQLLLDVRTIGGMSGSPVFRRETGEVIGVLNSGIKKEVLGVVAPNVVGVVELVEYVVSYAVPIDKTRLATWLTAFAINPDTP